MSNQPVYDPSQDETWSSPYVDVNEIRTRSTLLGEISYYHIHGGFENTNVKFLCCFPREGFRRRFFQHVSPFPGPDEENASLSKSGAEDLISFALTSGSAFVECNMGSTAVFGGAADPTIFYRSNAAAAMACRAQAEALFGPGKVYGYIFGGSGGGYKTISCVESTASWDGAVPFVIGSPVSLPSCLTVPAFGKRVLRHHLNDVVDALDPGGSGRPEESLNEEERAALKEMTLMGFPPRMITFLRGADDGALPVLTPGVRQMDPSYFTDFWTVPGYPGADPESSASRDRIQMEIRVLSTGRLSHESAVHGSNGTDDAWQKMMEDAGGYYIEVDQVPSSDYLLGTDILFPSGGRLRLGAVSGNRLIPGVAFGMDSAESLISALKPGDTLTLDNSDYIAIQTYHRHQVPADPSFHAWDQFRSEKFPQRPRVISYDFTAGGSGSVQSGNVHCPVIIMNSLMDADFPWQADWYYHAVKSVLGEDAPVRLWYNDNTPHGDVADLGEQYLLVSYLGMLSQALLSLSDWVEKGILPPDNTGYTLRDNQVTLAPEAENRRGIQPLAELTGPDGKRTECLCGETVTLTAVITLPPCGGTIEKLEWHFESEPFHEEPSTVFNQEGNVLTVTADHTFRAPGTFFPAVQITSNLNPCNPYTCLLNLDRTRVVVSAPAIRHPRAEDLKYLENICADAGAPVEDTIFREAILDVFCRAYRPYSDYSFVAVDPADHPVGYVLCAPDFVSFRVPESDNPVTGPMAHGTLSLLSPFAADYPAHLHIDLLPPYQGQGLGTALMSRLISCLKESNIPGVCLSVSADNPGALRFYERLSFTPLARDKHQITLGLKLSET